MGWRGVSGASFTKAAAYAAELVRSGTRAGGVSFELAPLIGPSHPWAAGPTGLSWQLSWS